MAEVNPYLSPLLDPPTPPGTAAGGEMGSHVLQTGTDRRKAQSKREAVAELLSDMSMVDAVHCITSFLRCDKR